MSYYVGLRVLRAKIRGFQAEGEALRKRALANKGERRHALHLAKRELGVHCRIHLVAYGLLRGVPYERVERCAPSNKIDPQAVLDVMLAHAPWQLKMYVPVLDVDVVKPLVTSQAPRPSSETPVHEVWLARARGLVSPTSSHVHATSAPALSRAVAAPIARHAGEESIGSSVKCSTALESAAGSRQ